MLGTKPVFPLLLASLLPALSCSGKDKSVTGPLPVASVTVTAPANMVDEFDSLQFTATPKDANGNVLTGRTVTWSTNAGTKATISSSGLLHALQGGTITVTATCDGVPGNAPITITVPVAAVMLNPSSATLYAGDTVRLTPTLLGPTGDTPTDSALTWTSSDTSVATVLAGLVTARDGGSVTVKATAKNGKFGQATIASNSAVATVTISPKDTSIYVTNTAPYITIVRDAHGDTLTRWQEPCPSLCNVAYPVQLQSLDTSVAARLGGCCTFNTNKPGVDSIVATSRGISDTGVIHVQPLAFGSVVVGNAQACGLNADSVAYCWGGAHPTVTSTGSHFVQLDVGNYTECGLTAAGATVCFQDTSATPLGAPPSDSLQVGATFLCGLPAGGAAWCSGGNGYGQLGSGDTSNSRTAVNVTGGHSFVSIAAGVNNACGIVTGGAAYCWGSNGGGLLGSGDTVSFSSAPLAVAGGQTFAQISTGYGHDCGVTASGAGYCWGSNQFGELGSGDTASHSSTPQLVAGGLQFAMISAGSQHSCGVTTSGAAYCWGAAGLLGNASGTGSGTPVAVDGGLTFLTLDAGIALDPSDESTCGRTTGGAVYCWGNAVLGADGIPLSHIPIKVQFQQ